MYIYITNVTNNITTNMRNIMLMEV